MAQVAAAGWAVIGALALIGTIKPTGGAGADVVVSRGLGVGAAAMAVGLLAMPARYRSNRVFEALLGVMALYVGVLTYVGGSERGDLLLLFILVVFFSAYFFPWRRSVAHLVLVAGLVGSRLAVVDGVDPNDVATFAVATISVWAAVVFLSMKQTERETHLRQSTDLLDPETGLLSPRGLDQALEAELSRAIRHARPLSLIFLEVSGSSLEATEGIESRRLTTTLARAVLSRIRTEDSAARLDRFKFAVLAPETGDNGASAMAKSLSEQVRKRLVSLGYQNSSFSVAVGWADYQYDELPRQELFKHADTSLAAAILANEGITFPPMETLARETVPELPGTH